MSNYRFSNARTLLLTVNLAFAAYLVYNGVDGTVKGLALAATVLCILSLYDNLVNRK